MAKKRILIIHDRFQYRGGGERLCLALAQGLRADIATEYWNEEDSFPRREAPGNIITLGKQVKWRGFGYLSAQWRFFWKTRFIREYDTIIFSGNNCLSAAWRVPQAKKVMYCHTPVRYAYDLKDYYYQRYAWWQKPLYLALVYLARLIYRWGLGNMDRVVANSRNVQRRLHNLVGYTNDVVVINPPIDTQKFTWQGQSDYYLSFARLVDLKRVGDIVRAFAAMPDKKLVVASGGPEFETIKKMAENLPNVSVTGFVSELELRRLVGNCIACIYIPVDEDFGMSPLEAAAAGKPTIGVDEGGLQETIIHQKTGYLIPGKYTVTDLQKAVAWLHAEQAQAMRQSCEAQAARFGVTRFIEAMRQQIES